MNRRRTTQAFVGLCFALLLSSCAARRAPGPGPSSAGAEVGVYKGRIIERDGRSRRFRLLLFAELPDRIHGELVSPLGRTEVIVDGGGGRLSVAVVRERVAFVGRAGPDSMERIVGFPVSMEQFVRALLTGGPPPGGLELKRSGGEEPSLPALLEIGRKGRVLRIELRRLDALRTPSGSLGSGNVPQGFREEALGELDWELFSGLEGEEDGP